MATELKFRTIWPRFTRLSRNNTSFLNCPRYKSKPCYPNFFYSLVMNEAQMFTQSAKAHRKVGGKKALSSGKGRDECDSFIWGEGKMVDGGDGPPR